MWQARKRSRFSLAQNENHKDEKSRRECGLRWRLQYSKQDAICGMICDSYFVFFANFALSFELDLVSCCTQWDARTLAIFLAAYFLPCAAV